MEMNISEHERNLQTIVRLFFAGAFQGKTAESIFMKMFAAFDQLWRIF